MAKSKTTSSQDLIQMHWGTICFEVCDQTVRSGLQDLEILELDESPDPVRTAFVQFSGETSKETAIQTLRQIIEAIERDGLPETTQRMLRKYGTVIMQMQQHLEKAHEIAQELPPELRECSLSLLASAVEPWSAAYLKERFDELGISEDEADKGDSDE